MTAVSLFPQRRQQPEAEVLQLSLMLSMVAPKRGGGPASGIGSRATAGVSPVPQGERMRDVHGDGVRKLLVPLNRDRSLSIQRFASVRTFLPDVGRLLIRFSE